ncbi:putative heat shock 70 kDa protein 12A [Rhizoctonia solani 123E]|uniref:Putative heat shock 70 kDa protein 12A n=1 Tax=Rhizoctonia solani 123E TaxID=1423351 RepID=A0A074RU53_9AGAM|nr:putative heat shock 70 kDa protein 12A [Rhizoctonia solani 123E]
MVTRGGPRSANSQQLNEVWEEENKIVVGIDIGTTQSGVALTYLEKGERQEIHRIGKWPGQGEQSQRAKVPTVMWYNLETKKVFCLLKHMGIALANHTSYQAELFGAEALSRDGCELAEDNGWFLAKYFKLHLQPKDLRKADMKMEPLPPGITLAQIYSDFLGYLLKHTKAFVEKRMARGKEVWEKHKPTMEVVIAHPNGWDTPEQDFLRKAAIDSGFVDSESQVQFVTEAEASVHYCIHHSNLSSKLQVGTNLAVCDAGGSTVDTTLYSIVSTTPVLQLREVKASDTVQAGGILVNMKFEEFLRIALNNLDLSSAQVDSFAAAGIEDFENLAKRNFGNRDETPTGSETVSIRVANTGNYGTALTKIYRGCMKMPNPIIKECFDVSARPILSSVGEQLKNQTVQHILLVGGFGDSPYLHSQFETHFGSDGCEVVLANDFTSKAVADGSVIWNTLCSVISRTPRRSFGMVCARPCLPWMPEAEGRDAYIGPHGIPIIPGRWVQIAKKGVPVDAEEIFRDTVHHVCMQSNPTSISLIMDLFSYSGDDEPTWAKDEEGDLLPKFKKICTITAQLWDIEGALQKKTGLLGVDYWDLAVDMCICFGTTELQAYLEWEKNVSNPP